MSKDAFVWDDKSVIGFHKYYMGGNSEDIFVSLQEFKQSKMPKKEWEVTEIINKHGGKITKAMDHVSWEDYCGLKSFDGFKINAVKDLRSEEVFTVGDMVEKPMKGVIIYFIYFQSCEVHVNIKGANNVDHYSGDGNGLLKSLPPQSKPEQPKEQKDDFLEYLVFQKENHVRENLFERASEWRMVERLYRAYLKMQSKKPIGAYVSIEQIVSDYLSKEKKEQPKRIEVIGIKFNGFNKSSFYVGLNENIMEERFRDIKAAIERVLNDDGEPTYNLTLLKDKLEISISDPNFVPDKIFVNGKEYKP